MKIKEVTNAHKTCTPAANQQTGDLIDEATKTLSPEELQVKSLADKAKQLTQQKKQLQARQALTKAQEKMRDVSV